MNGYSDVDIDGVMTKSGNILSDDGWQNEGTRPADEGLTLDENADSKQSQVKQMNRLHLESKVNASDE